MKKFGFTLLELLISMGISGALLLFIMTMGLHQQKSLNTIVSKYERTDLIQEIRNILIFSDSCIATLGGHNPNNTLPGTVTQIIQVRGLIDTPANAEAADPALSDLMIFESNSDEDLAKSYGNNKVKFLSFSIDSSSTHNISPETRGITHLVIDAVTPKLSFARRVPQKIRINVETNAANEIIKCQVFQIEGLSLEKLCSNLGGKFDPNGRGGLGNCYSLTLTGGLTVGGNLNIYPDPSLDDSGSANLTVVSPYRKSVNMNQAESVTAKAFCDTLGGRFNPSGHSGNGECQNMQIQGGIGMFGDLNVRGEFNFLEGSPAPNPAVPSSHLGVTEQSICATLGGSYNPTGRNGDGDCVNIHSTGSISIIGDVFSNLPISIEN